MKYLGTSITLLITVVLPVGMIGANASSLISCQGQNYTADVVPKRMAVTEKKRRFRCLVQTDIESVYAALLSQYDQLADQLERGDDIKNIDALRVKYRVDDNHQLLAAIKPHPISITIAQAAIESAWGTSRFFREANNIFGIRPFTQFEPRIAATGTMGKNTVWLKKYPTLKASVVDYYLVLARGRAFHDFRRLKMKTVNPHVLVEKLNHYSERKAEYGKELSAMIRYNHFRELD